MIMGGLMHLYLLLFLAAEEESPQQIYQYTDEEKINNSEDN